MEGREEEQMRVIKSKTRRAIRGEGDKRSQMRKKREEVQRARGRGQIRQGSAYMRARAYVGFRSDRRSARGLELEPACWFVRP